MKGKSKTFLLASSDLSHFHSSERAETLDKRFISHIKNLDPQGLARDLSSGKCEACGHAAVITVLVAATRLGVKKGEILCYSHSGKITGDNKRVVGYLSAALFKSYYKDQHRN
jgi:AmmeMemoRadiSam system protein B